MREENVVPALLFLLVLKFLLRRRVLLSCRQPASRTPHGRRQRGVRQPRARRKVLRTAA